MANVIDRSEWFTEVYEHSGSAFSLALKSDCLHHQKTPFQTIEIYDTTKFGKLMVIDGFVMLTSLDNFFYHEMISHTALFTHPHPKNIVIIGGGDCGTLREVLKHKQVEQVWQVEIDEQVTRLAEKYFPELCESNNDPRCQLDFGDGIEWIASAASATKAGKQNIDLIIVDSSEPTGPGESLFNEAFYHNCYRALGDDGILIQQSESPLVSGSLIKEMHTAMRSAGFCQTKIIPFPQPVYPTGLWSVTMAAKRGDLNKFRYNDADNKDFLCQYYSAALHQGTLATPPFIAAFLAAI